jgi:hypothetical protein
MFGRPLWLTLALAAAALVPYLALDDQVAATARKQLKRLTGEDQPAQHDPLAAAAEPNPAAAPATSAPAVPTTTVVPLEEAIRFSVTPEWVTTRWPRVTSVTGDTSHLGLRVPLVSGTEASDVAGSLTYYFDQQHQLQRLTLLGVTGDESRLVALACGQFGLRPTQTLERGLYYGGDVNEPTSSLRVANLPVVKAESATARVQVALDLRRADVAKFKQPADREEKILPESYRRW